MSSISVQLANSEIFERFSSEPLEMRISAEGRLVKPLPIFKISGLDPMSYYWICIGFKQVGNDMYNYTNGRWAKAENLYGSMKTPSTYQTVPYSEKWKLGSELMRKPINFEKIYVTNIQTLEPTYTIPLVTGRKYVPELSIHQLYQGGTLSDPLTFSNPCTEFITVSRYRNKNMGKLKGSKKTRKYVGGGDNL